MNETHRFHWDKHALVWTAGIMVVSAAYILLVGRPQLTRIKSLTTDLNTKNAELASRSHSIGTLNKANAEVSMLASKAAQFEERIPPQPELGGFLEEVARVAQKRNLQSDTIQPGEPVRTAEVVALPIAIKVHGPFSAVHGFVQDIEHMSRLTRFDQFKVATDETHPGTVKAELNLKVFYGATQGVKAG